MSSEVIHAECSKSKDKTLSYFCVWVLAFLFPLIVSAAALAQSTSGWKWGGSDLYNSIETSFIKGHNDKQSLWVTPDSVAVVQAGLTVINRQFVTTDANGNPYTTSYAQLIEAEGAKYGSYEGVQFADYMKAVILHESGGGKRIFNKSSGALCAFQIYGTTIDEVGRLNGISDTRVVAARLMSDKAFCVHAGAQILDQKIRSSYAKNNIYRALCLYNGQFTILKQKDWCWAMDEYYYMVKIITDKALVIDIDSIRSSATFGQGTIKALDGTELGKTLNCQDHTKTNLPKAFADMENMYRSYSDNLRQTTYYQSIQAQSSANTRPPSVGKIWCINDIQYRTMIMAGLLEGIKTVLAYVTNMVTQVLNSVCNYVVSATMAAVSTILNSICIDLPDLSYGLSLPGIKARKGCNGVSLGQVMLLNGSGLSSTDLKANIDNLIKGVPGIDALNTPTWETPSLAAPLRFIFGSKTTTTGGSP